MKIAFPVQEDLGMDSIVYNHFGSAPVFVIVDPAAQSIASLKNLDQHHAHDACNPMKALDDQRVDAVVVGGIGGRALSGLNRMGIKVHKSQAATVRQNLALLDTPGVPVIGQRECCGGHSADGGCAH